MAIGRSSMTMQVIKPSKTKSAKPKPPKMPRNRMQIKQAVLRPDRMPSMAAAPSPAAPKPKATKKVPGAAGTVGANPLGATGSANPIRSKFTSGT